MAARISPSPVFYAIIIRRLFRNKHIMWMAFPQARTGNAHKACLFLHLSDSSAASIPHRLTQSPDQLVNQGPQHALIRNTRLDALGDQARLLEGIALEVAVFTITALLHGGD